MLAVLFVISACYQFANCVFDLVKLFADDEFIYTPGVCAFAFLINLTLAVLSCVAVSLGGTFAFVLGIIFAVFSFISLAGKIFGGVNGCFDVFLLLYSLTMMVLFIIAVCIV